MNLKEAFDKAIEGKKFNTFSTSIEGIELESLSNSPECLFVYEKCVNFFKDFDQELKEIRSNGGQSIDDIKKIWERYNERCADIEDDLTNIQDPKDENNREFVASLRNRFVCAKGEINKIIHEKEKKAA